MRQLPPLSALRAFEAAVRNGSFSEAAKELSVTPTAISHQIRSLEDYIGTSLFYREVRKVRPTPAAETLYPPLREGFDAFADAVARTKQQRPLIAISATTAFTARWLVPTIGKFVSAHPDISLRLHASDDPIDFHRDSVSLAVRYGQGPYPGLASKVLIEDQFAAVAGPGFKVEAPEQISELPIIEFDWKRQSVAHPVWSHWTDQANMSFGDTQTRLHFSDETHAIQAAVAGEGVALIGLTLIADEIAAGRLVQLPGPVIKGPNYFLLSPRMKHQDVNVKEVETWLFQEAKRRRQILSLSPVAA